MARREVIDCDKCGKECNDTTVHIAIPNGYTDQYGGHTTERYYEYEEKDLCPRCIEKLFKYMMSFRWYQPEEGPAKWLSGQSVYPGAKSNQAIELALQYFDIEDKS